MSKTIDKLWAFRQAPFRGMLAPLTIADFRKLWAGNAVWWGTRFMEFIVIGWLVLDLTDSPLQVAAMGFYRSIPFLIVGFLSGPVIDQLGRRKTILIAQLANWLITSTIAILLWFDVLALWQLAVGSFLMGVAWSIDWPARRSFVPDLVGKTRTVDALLLENFGQNIARIAGPYFGGILIDSFGPRGAFATMAILSGLTFVILLSLSDQPVPRNTSAAQTSPFTTIREGLSYVRHSQPIMGALTITVIMNFLVFPYVTQLPVFARDVLGQGPTGLGTLGAASGLGAFLGLFIINRVRQYFSNGWIFIVGTCFQSMVLFAFAASEVYALSFALLFLAGIGQSCFGIMQSSIILLAASDEMRSRAMGTLVLAIGAGPLGQLEIGALAESLGAPLAVRIHTGIATLAIIITAFALPGLRQPPASENRSNA